MDVVVITVFVALVKDTCLTVMGEVVVKVVLGHVGLCGKVSVGKVINIHKVLTSKEIGQDLIVFRHIELAVEAARDLEVLEGPILEVERKVEVLLVYAALLLDILAAAVLTHLVHLIDAVPVEVDN